MKRGYPLHLCYVHTILSEKGHIKGGLSQQTGIVPMNVFNNMRYRAIAFAIASLALLGARTETTPLQPIQIGEGEGGDYAYQLWQATGSSEYYLFIWERDRADTDEEPAASYNFDSAEGAVNFFSCRYARENLSTCNALVSSVSYDIPETCVFPWRECE